MGIGDWLQSLGQSASTRTRLLNDPFCRLQSAEEIRLAAELGIRIDANQAGVDDWLRLPGISIHQARSLVSLAQSGVQFHCLDDVAAALGVPLQRLKPLEPVLHFYYYDPNSLCAVQPINPNSASIQMLSRIPVVDLFLARAIVQNRERYGAYRSMADLQQRLALPPTITAELMHYLCF